MQISELKPVASIVGLCAFMLTGCGCAHDSKQRGTYFEIRTSNNADDYRLSNHFGLEHARHRVLYTGDPCVVWLWWDVHIDGKALETQAAGFPIFAQEGHNGTSYELEWSYTRAEFWVDRSALTFAATFTKLRGEIVDGGFILPIQIFCEPRHTAQTAGNGLESTFINQFNRSIRLFAAEFSDTPGAGVPNPTTNPTSKPNRRISVALRIRTEPLIETHTNQKDAENRCYRRLSTEMP